MVDGTMGASRVEIQPVTTRGEGNQAIMTGTTPVAMLQMATRTGELGPTMDPRAMPTTTKTGANRAHAVIVPKEAMRIMAKTGTSRPQTVTVPREVTRITAKPGASRAHIVTVPSGEMRIPAKVGTNKAQLIIVLKGDSLGAVLQDPGRLLTTPGLRATPVLLPGQRAPATIPTITIFRATCQALGKTMQALSLDSIADLTSLPKAGTSMVRATPPVMAATAVMGGAGRLHLKDRRFPARVVIKAGEEEATKAEVRRATGTKEVEAQEVDGTKTHPTTLDRPPTRGRRTSLGTPKAHQRIGSGSTGVALGIPLVLVMVTGGDSGCGMSMRSVGALGLLWFYCFSTASHTQALVLFFPRKGTRERGGVDR